MLLPVSKFSTVLQFCCRVLETNEIANSSVIVTKFYSCYIKRMDKLLFPRNHQKLNGFLMILRGICLYSLSISSKIWKRSLILLVVSLLFTFFCLDCILINQKPMLIHDLTRLHFCTLWKHQKTFGFLTFSRGTEM